jgi:hypothetical protein
LKTYRIFVSVSKRPHLRLCFQLLDQLVKLFCAAEGSAVKVQSSLHVSSSELLLRQYTFRESNLKVLEQLPIDSATAVLQAGTFFLGIWGVPPLVLPYLLVTHVHNSHIRLLGFY